MDPQFQPRHAADCGSAQGSLTIGGGRADGKAFRLAAASTVADTMQLQEGYADVCILTPDQWDSFAAGGGAGAACHFGSQSESDNATLDAGDYILGFRCVDSSPECQVDYTLTAQAS
jgi:hypothetical protein